MSVGKVYKKYKSHFEWKVPGITEFLRKENVYAIYSTAFAVNGKMYCRLFCQFIYPRFIIMPHVRTQDDRKPYLGPVYFRMVVKRADGDDYRSLTISETEVTERKSWSLSLDNVLTDIQGIAPDDVLSVHLTFYSSDVQFQNATKDLIDLKLETPLSSEDEIRTENNTASHSAIPVIHSVDRVMQKYKDLFLTGRKSDVVFKVETKEFTAHKIILASQSSVLERMFDHDMIEGISGCVEITDCHPDVFQIFLEYFYTGKVDVLTVDSAMGLYCIADKYAVDGLPKDCVTFLLHNLSVESLCDIMSLGIQFGETQLVDSANLYFVKNMKEIVATDKWKAFVSQNPDVSTEFLVKALDKVKLIPI